MVLQNEPSGFRYSRALRGLGKTFTMANVIEQVQRPTLGDFPQQNLGGTVVRGVQRVLSAQRSTLFCKLLRLLPTGSLHTRSVISISKKMRRSIPRLIGCGWLRLARWLAGAT